MKCDTIVCIQSWKRFPTQPIGLWCTTLQSFIKGLPRSNQLNLLGCQGLILEECFCESLVLGGTTLEDVVGTVV